MLHCPQDTPHFQCCRCNTPILRAADILSCGYHVKSGSAYLARSAWNLAVSEREDEVAYTSGTYRVRDVQCKTCGQALGITYVGASEESNAHKVGTFLLGQKELWRPQQKAARAVRSRVLRLAGRCREQAIQNYWLGLDVRLKAQTLRPTTGVVTPPLAASPAPPAELSGTAASADTCTAALVETAVLEPSSATAPAKVEEAAGAGGNAQTGADVKTQSWSPFAPAPAKAEEAAGAGGPAAEAFAAAPPAEPKASAAALQRPAASRRRSPRLAEPQGGRRPAAYFGICDLKYDRRRPRGQRLFVLELGNGRSSRFSGFGECITRNVQKFKLASPLDRSLLVENKKMTHDVFVDSGFEHLRPKQVCFPRVYTPELAQEVLDGLGRELGQGPVVLKLLNRCRGAGVVVARASQLDATLQLLLSPPEDPPSTDWGALEATLGLDPCSMQEQCLHWWSNECPLFAAERCESSQPVCQDGLEYDGTLRVGFVLLRTGKGDDETLAIDFLGGYWKLPQEPMSSVDARARCVSKARTGTAPVLPEDLQDVCRALSDALPAVFESERAGMVPSLMRRYAQEPLAFSFALARHAAAKVQQKALENARAVAKGAEPAAAEPPSVAATAPAAATGWASTPAGRQQLASVHLLFEMAEARIMEGSEDLTVFRESLPARDPATRAAASYIERQLGVLDAHMGDWDGAQVRFRRALELHRWNASAQYLVGVCQQRRSEHALAWESFARSIMMDPDFKAPYAGLGATALALGNWEHAAAVSAAGLRRHPQAFQCSYNLGLALGRKLQRGLGLVPSRSLSKEMTMGPLCPSLEEVPAEGAPEPPAWPRAADAAEAGVEGQPHVQCGVCGNPLLKVEDIISAGFRMLSGPAYLVRTAYNVRPAGEPQTVTYASGEYDVQEAACGRCAKALGVRYMGAAEERNRQKVGNFLIAQNFTVKKAPQKPATAPAGKKEQLTTPAAAAVERNPRGEDEARRGVQTPPVAPAVPAAVPKAVRTAGTAALARREGEEEGPCGAQACQVASSSAAAAAGELRRAKEQKEQTRTDWSSQDDELLRVLEQLSVRLAASPQRVAAAAAAAAARGPPACTEAAAAAAADATSRGEASEHGAEEQLLTSLCSLLSSRSGWASRHFRG